MITDTIEIRRYDEQSIKVITNKVFYWIDDRGKARGDLYPLTLNIYPIHNSDMYLVENVTYEDAYVMGIFSDHFTANQFCERYVRFHGKG